jgi:hypothetical protein
MRYKALGQKIGELVDEKNAAYGDFNAAGELLKSLYPNGIKVEQYGDMLCVVRILDKLRRIATDRDALGESPYQDIAGYGLLGAMANHVVVDELHDTDFEFEESELTCSNCGKPGNGVRIIPGLHTVRGYKAAMCFSCASPAAAAAPKYDKCECCGTRKPSTRAVVRGDNTNLFCLDCCEEQEPKPVTNCLTCNACGFRGQSVKVAGNGRYIRCPDHMPAEYKDDPQRPDAIETLSEELIKCAICKVASKEVTRKEVNGFMRCRCPEHMPKQRS